MQTFPWLPLVEGATESLYGHLDWVDWRNFGGWAFNPADMDVPVWLEVQVDERPATRFLANMLRTDLADVGIGTGRYGFQLHFPKPLDPRKPHSIAVRRVSDGAMLPNAPWELVPAPSSDPQSFEVLGAMISADIEAAAGGAQLAGLARFMVTQTDRVLQAACELDGGKRERELFRRRWSETLDNAVLEVAVPDPRPLALVIDMDLPDLGVVAGLQRLGLRVAVVAARGLVAEGEAAAALREAGVLVEGAPVHFTVEDVLRRHQGEFRLVVLRGAVMAAAYGVAARLHHPRARILAWLDDPAQDVAAGISAQLMSDAVLTGSAAAAATLAQRVAGREVHVVAVNGTPEQQDAALARACLITPRVNPGLS